MAKKRRPDATAAVAKQQQRDDLVENPGQGSDTLAQKIAWLCVHLAVFLVPIAISNLGGPLPFTYDQFDIVKISLLRVFGLIGFGAWAWSFLSSGGTLRRTKLDYLILAFLAWVLITSFTSIHIPTAIFGKYRRFEGFLAFFNYAILFFLTVQYASRASRIRSLAKTLFWSGTIVSLYGVLQYVGIEPLAWGDLPFEQNRSFSTFGNPDLLGGYVIFPLVLGLALALSEDDPKWRLFYWVGQLFALSTWLTAFTRGAWIGGVVGLAIVLIAAYVQRIRMHKSDIVGGGILVGVAGTIIAWSMTTGSGVMNFGARVASIFEFQSGSGKTRFQIWSAALRAIQDNPIFGLGADTFRLAFPKYKPVEYVASAGYLSVADNVHNYPLQLAAGIGIPGLILLYGVFFYTAWLSAPLVFKRYERNDRLVMAGIWAACVAYVTHLFFGLSVTGSSFLLWVLMALLVAPAATNVKYNPNTLSMFAGAIIVALCGLGLIGNGIYVVADNYYLKARIGSRGIDRIENAQKAVSLNPTNDMYQSEVGLAYFDQFVALVLEARNQQQSGGDAEAAYRDAANAFTKSEQALRSVIEFVPAEYDNYVFLANNYNLAAEYLNPQYAERAIAVGLDGVEVEPFGPAIRFQLSRGYMLNKQAEKAIPHMKKAVEMDPNYAEGWVLLGDIYSTTGKKAEALEAYKVALKLQPSMKSSLDPAMKSLESNLASKQSEPATKTN